MLTRASRAMVTEELGQVLSGWENAQAKGIAPFMEPLHGKPVARRLMFLFSIRKDFCGRYTSFWRAGFAVPPGPDGDLAMTLVLLELLDHTERTGYRMGKDNINSLLAKVGTTVTRMRDIPAPEIEMDEGGGGPGGVGNLLQGDSVSHVTDSAADRQWAISAIQKEMAPQADPPAILAPKRRR